MAWKSMAEIYHKEVDAVDTNEVESKINTGCRGFHYMIRKQLAFVTTRYSIWKDFRAYREYTDRENCKLWNKASDLKPQKKNYVCDIMY